MMLKLDHFAVAAHSLQEAREFIETSLGLAMQDGGKHDVFGTHNCLLGLADGLYLEAIAIDPGAPSPDRSRWFGLDRFAGAARPTNWICATGDLDEALSRMGDKAGHPVHLRRGDLRWKMAVPNDGILPYDNLFPALIEWQGPAHPSAVLADAGCRLRRLVVTHPEARSLQADLAGLLQDSRVVFDVGPSGLVAEVETPHGPRVLQ